MSFAYPPEISDGILQVGSKELSASDFDWKAVDLADPYAVNEENIRTTSIGKATVNDRTVRVILGFDQNENVPLLSVTYYGDGMNRLGFCSFNFAEVQK